MKVLLTGGKGFLGRYAALLESRAHEVEVADREMMDVTSLDAALRIMERSQPDVVCTLPCLALWRPGQSATGFMSTWRSIPRVP